MNIRQMLFRDIATGCTNHGCVVRGRFDGMGTHGTCHCVTDLKRSQLQILQGRINLIGNVELPPKTKEQK